MMESLWHQLGPELHPSEFVAAALIKLIVAAFLGAAIGLERQINKSPAGLRTNMFMCVGTALFTILSFAFTGTLDDHTRIAAQIVSGIGFIGAGTILHSKSGITGITTAATIFVVAAVGMAVGGGQYQVAVFATILVLTGLHVLGKLEARFNLKALFMQYEIKGKDAEGVMTSVNNAMEEEHLIMDGVHFVSGKDSYRLQFTVQAVHNVHQMLTEKLRKSTNIDSVQVIRSPNYEG